MSHVALNNRTHHVRKRFVQLILDRIPLFKFMFIIIYMPTYLGEDAPMFLQHLLKREPKRECVDEPGRCEKTRDRSVNIRSHARARPETRGDGLVQHLKARITLFVLGVLL